MPSSRVLSPAGPSTAAPHHAARCEIRHPGTTRVWRPLPGESAIPLQESCADRRNESVGPLGGWTLGSTTLSLAHFLLEECQKPACRSVAKVTCASARQALSGDTVSTYQTQRLRCVAGSACSIEIRVDLHGMWLPADLPQTLSQSRCHQIAASLPLIHGHGCHASFRGACVLLQLCCMCWDCLHSTAFTHSVSKFYVVALSLLSVMSASRVGRFCF